MLDYQSGSWRAQGGNQPHLFARMSVHIVICFALILSLSGCILLSNTPEDTPKQPEKTTREHTPLPPTALRPPEQNIQPLPPKEAPILDLHTRLTQGFRLEFDTFNHPSIDRYIQWYSQRPHHMAQLCKNAKQDLHYITELMEQHNMPMEFALLPGIESTFEAKAVSYSGAQGLWQIMPRTADHLKLTRNQWYDGRLDIHASTEAAIRYLKEINAQFNGDWLLTLAAYNAGPGTIRRVIRNSNQPANYWALPLPEETQNYVPKLMALTRVFQNPTEYGLPKCDIPNWPTIHRVALKYQTDLTVAAQLADMPLKRILALNPAINHWTTPPQGPKTLYIESAKAPRFILNEQALTKQQRILFVQHTIKSGDTLSELARKYKTTTQQIKSFNGMHSSKLVAGKTLKIPTQGEKSLYAKLKYEQSKPKNKRKTVYKVRSGDTWWDIAKKFGVPHKKLAQWNGKSSRDTLSIGTLLTVWQPA